MVRPIAIFTLCLVLQGSSGGMFHEFYVSLTEVRFNSDRNKLEVSMRIFPDDLDRVLLELYGLATHLGTELEPPEADSLLSLYINENFSIRCDTIPVNLVYLGKEPEADAIWSYLESDQIPVPGSFEVTNSILTEVFPDQVNIVQLYVGAWNKGLLLNREEQKAYLQIKK